MKLIFCGTSHFAVPFLEYLIPRYSILAVLSKADQKKGRGQHLQPTPVKSCAEKHQLPIYTPKKIDEEMIEILKSLQPDCIISTSYGILIPPAAFDIAPHGWINIHPSLLPRWRGASPIQNAIMAGDSYTGVSIHFISKEIDAGDVVAQAQCPIQEEETQGSLEKKLIHTGMALLAQVIEDMTHHRVQRLVQPTECPHYAHKIKKEDLHIHWNSPALLLQRQIRAYDPKPNMHAQLNGKEIIVLKAYVQSSNHLASPGSIIEITDQHIAVQTGEGLLCLTTIQFPGKKPYVIHNTKQIKQALHLS